MAHFCIYSLTNRHTGDVYVGRSSKLKRRLKEHASSSKCGSQMALHGQVREYGMDSFDVGVLQRVETLAEASQAEREWIVKLQPKLNTIHNPVADRSMFGSGQRNRPQRPMTEAEARHNKVSRAAAVAAIKGQKQTHQHVERRKAAYQRRREAGLPLGRPRAVNHSTVIGLRQLGLRTEDIAIVAGCVPSRVIQILSAPARGIAIR